MKRTFLTKNIGEFPFKYLFLRRRILIRKFCKEYLLDFDSQNIKTFFNYYLDVSKLNHDSVVYSFGLHTNIHFEEYLIKRFNCRVFCFDPTPASVNLMKNLENTKIIYKPFGIWKEDKKVKFYYPDSALPDSYNGSIVNYTGDVSKGDYLQCCKLKTLMKVNNHTNIDVLKMDIEGAAIEVLNQILEDSIFPEQIAVEFEVTENDNISKQEFIDLTENIIELIKKLESLNYKCYHMPRFSNQPYSSIEVLFVKNIHL